MNSIEPIEPSAVQTNTTAPTKTQTNLQPPPAIFVYVPNQQQLVDRLLHVIATLIIIAVVTLVAVLFLLWAQVQEEREEDYEAKLDEIAALANEMFGKMR